MCDYQCTSVSFITLSNRIEKSIRQRESNRNELNYFFPNLNALLSDSQFYIFNVYFDIKHFKDIQCQFR